MVLMRGGASRCFRSCRGVLGHCRSGRASAHRLHSGNRDGTGERDYIHVVDLAAAHLAALDHSGSVDGCEAINVGTGRGITVKELVAAYERACGRPIPVEIVARRPGDVASSYASTSKAETLLGWRAALDVDAMCMSSWRWQSDNPQGYSEN